MDEKKIYRLSRVILTLFSYITFSIIFMEDGTSFFHAVTVLFAVITFGLSFLSTPITKKIIQRGERLQRIKKILYYLSFPVFAVFVLFLYGRFIENFIGCTELGWIGLGYALIFAFLQFILEIVLFLPILQTYIVIGLKKIKKK